MREGDLLRGEEKHLISPDWESSIMTSQAWGVFLQILPKFLEAASKTFS